MADRRTARAGSPRRHAPTQYPQGWVWAWTERAMRLRAWGPAMHVELHVDDYQGGDRGLARTWAVGQGRIDVYADDDRADVLATVLHELAHVAVGPGVAHAPPWRWAFAAAVRELTGHAITRSWWPRADQRKLDERATEAVRRWFAKRGEMP